MSTTLKIPATRYTREIQISVSRKAASFGVYSAVGDKPFFWSLWIAPFKFGGGQTTTTPSATCKFWRHGMLLRSAV